MPSTDTRAALVELLTRRADWIDRLCPVTGLTFVQLRQDFMAATAADLRKATDFLLRSPAERGEGERDGRLREAVWEFVRNFGRNGTKTGRADYVAMVPLDRIEYLRRALGSDFASPLAPVERCGAVTTFGGAFPPMVCTLPMGHTGRHDADSAAPAPVEGTRERTVEEVTQVAFSAYTMGAAANGPDDAVVSLRRMARECADRILAALPVQGERVEGEEGS